MSPKKSTRKVAPTEIQRLYKTDTTTTNRVAIFFVVSLVRGFCWVRVCGVGLWVVEVAVVVGVVSVSWLGFGGWACCVRWVMWGVGVNRRGCVLCWWWGWGEIVV